ncbi:hypothetical protein NP233_g8067 [Leucocoprinus birnbaumii]|uniref:GRIP domain-containing protein n=1 Tax=Leucocoprinus birnbaumii TaxID=56174 RepID=A0AAD5YNG5_9AGAR|nr:hypothetical protein NP233_g8067 [Leucocoprinus birnbaumii]
MPDAPEPSPSPSSPKATTNGDHPQLKSDVVPEDNHDDDDVVEDEDPQAVIERLREELEQTREEKENLASQHQTLLSKVSNIRNTLGAKLKQDAEELDRQEQLISQLTSERSDLSSTLSLLQSELTTTSTELSSLQSKYDSLRAKMSVNTQETMHSERQVRDLQNQLEETKLDRDEWVRRCEEEKVVSEEARGECESLRREVEVLRGEREGLEGELEREREKARNLGVVLQDFQAAKDHELRQAVKDYESQLLQATQSLAEFKSRALNAENLKEKNLLIGKLRHEAVIMNEHLIEALRRLRRSSTETKSSVDGRLVTNILLQFLTTPRTDTKRFEMLALLGSILGWGEEEREKAGLQRAGAHAVSYQRSNGGSGTGGWGGGGGKSPELEKTDETESFSRLWVEFLLKEANAGDGVQQPPLTPSTTASSLPGSPVLSPSATKLPQVRRLASIGSAATASTPELVNGKGKERARE